MQKINVIISTYNRCDVLKDTIESLLKVIIPRGFDYEILIVDNNSTVNTRLTVQNFADRFRGRLKYLFFEKQGKYSALNFGIKNITGEIVALTDDDCLFDENWLLEGCATFKKFGCDAVGGRVLPLYPPKTPVWIKENQDLLCGFLGFYDFGKEIKPYESRVMYPFVGTNMFIRRSCFDRYCFFNENFGPGKGTKGGDTRFFRQLEEKGVSFYYNGRSLVFHRVHYERLNYIYLARWSIFQGRYFAGKESVRQDEISLVCWGGVPRYLFRDVVSNGFLGLLSFLNHRKFLQYWKSTFKSIGMVLEYRKNRKCQNLV